MKTSFTLTGLDVRDNLCKSPGSASSASTVRPQMRANRKWACAQGRTVLKLISHTTDHAAYSENSSTYN